MANLVKQAKALFQGPPDKGIGAANRNVDEYVAATKGSSSPKPAASSTPSKPAPIDKVSNGKYGSRPGEQRIDTTGMTSFKKGGRVKKTGAYKLHKGEQVANPRQSKKIDKKGGMKALFGK